MVALLLAQKKKPTYVERLKNLHKKIKAFFSPFSPFSSRRSVYWLQGTEKDDTIKKLKKENEEKGQVASPGGGLSAEKEAQMKQRLKELATENVDILFILMEPVYYLKY